MPFNPPEPEPLTPEQVEQVEEQLRMIERSFAAAPDRPTLNYRLGGVPMVVVEETMAQIRAKGWTTEGFDFVWKVTRPSTGGGVRVVRDTRGVRRFR